MKLQFFEFGWYLILLYCACNLNVLEEKGVDLTNCRDINSNFNITDFGLQMILVHMEMRVWEPLRQELGH